MIHYLYNLWPREISCGHNICYVLFQRITHTEGFHHCIAQGAVGIVHWVITINTAPGCIHGVAHTALVVGADGGAFVKNGMQNPFAYQGAGPAASRFPQRC